MTSLAKSGVVLTEIKGVLIIESNVLGDEPNWFMKAFNAFDLSGAFRSNVKFIQDNQLCLKR